MGLETLKRLCAGSAFRVLGTVIVSLVLLTTGAFATGVIGVPALEHVDNEFGDVTEETTEIRTNLTITNPNPIGLRWADIDAAYTISMNDVEMASGESDAVGLDSGTSTERLTTRMDNTRISEWWVTHIDRDEETNVRVDATVSSGALGRTTSVSHSRTIETDLISSFDSDERRPVDADAPLVSDPLLYIESTRAEWGSADDETTELELRFELYNPKSYDIPLSQLGYTTTMNDVVVGDGETTRDYLLRSGQVTTVETTTRIDTQRLDDWWVTHVQNDEVTDLRIEFDARVHVLGTAISLPLDALTYEETIETDILGSADDTVADEGADGTTADEEPSGARERPTESGSESDDGGILSDLPLSSSAIGI